jgi:hypothetical protein
MTENLVEVEATMEFIPEDEEKNKTPICPVCESETLMYSGHCVTCMTCGWGLCS